MLSGIFFDKFSSPCVLDVKNQGEPQIRRATLWERFSSIFTTRFTEEKSVYFLSDKQLVDKIKEIQKKNATFCDTVQRYVFDNTRKVTKIKEKKAIHRLISGLALLNSQRKEDLSVIRMNYFVESAREIFLNNKNLFLKSQKNHEPIELRIEFAEFFQEIWPQEAERLAKEIFLLVYEVVKKKSFSLSTIESWLTEQDKTVQNNAIDYVKQVLDEKGIDEFLRICTLLTKPVSYVGIGEDSRLKRVSLDGLKENKDFITKFFGKVNSVDQLDKLINVVLKLNSEQDEKKSFYTKCLDSLKTSMDDERLNVTNRGELEASDANFRDFCEEIATFCRQRLSELENPKE